MKILKYAFILVFALSLGSCHKDDVNVTEGETTTNPPGVNVQSAVNGDVLGYVYDEDNSPVSGANISMLGKSTTTDQYGVFKFKNVELDQQGTYLTATKGGYILGSDMIFGLEGVNHTSRVKMLRLSDTGTFPAESGGEVAIEGGGTITFEANSIVTSDGTPFSGSVKVTAKRIATDDPTIADMMPGGLIANAEDGSTVILGSMGMVAVELRNASGQELNIAASKTAQITFPIAANQRAGAPSEIKLWSFDEVSGRWEEEGTAKKEGDVYVAEVRHFSFWNCDAPFPLVNICGKVLYDDGTPASQVSVSVGTGPYGTAYGYTNADGSFGGKVPKGEVLTIKVYNYLCQGDEAIYTIEVGPFENKTVLDDIILDIPTVFSFEGLVVCAADPIPNATVIYSYNDYSFVIEAEDDGSFEIAVNDACGTLDQVTVFAIDPATGTASSTVLIDPNTDPTLELQVCNDCGFTVDIVADDSVDNCEKRQLKAEVDGNGTYSYLWTNNDTASSTNASQATGNFCVTVTETSLGCEMIKCTSLNWWTPLNAEVGSYASCDGAEGTINVWPFGGDSPYTYTFSDPSLMNTGSDSIVIIIAPVGTYGITITDSEGCTVEKEVTVEAAAGLSIDLQTQDECFLASVTATVSGGQEPYFYAWSDGSTSQQPTRFFEVSGTYCVTVTDEFGCSAEECILVEVIDPFVDVNLEVTSCSQGTYTLQNNSFSLFIELFYEGQTYFLANGEEATIDFIPGEFDFGNWILITDLTGNCSTEMQFNLPILQVTPNNQLSYSVTDRTCDTCSDGGIQLNDEYLNYNGWFGAQEDKIYVIDEMYVDVTTAAEANMLEAGTYYVVIDDLNTGCYIYSDKVIIE